MKDPKALLQEAATAAADAGAQLALKETLIW